MLLSKFISDIFNLLQDQSENELIEKQIQCLSNIEYDYTSMGLFVRFSYSEEVFNYRLKNENTILGEIFIKSNELNDHALGHFFLKEGIIDYLEIWSVSGNYPNKELDNYIITQDWVGSLQRQIIK